MTIYISGDPVGKQRPRHDPTHPNQKPHTPEKTRDYEKRIGWAWKQAHGPMYEGPVEISVTIFLQCPKSYSKKTREAMLSGEILPTRTPDCSNVLKSAKDGLNKIAYKDDSQIAKTNTERFYAEEPGLLIIVRPVNKDYMKESLRASLDLRNAIRRNT